VKFEALVVVRLKIQEQSELNFVSRTIQWHFAIENFPETQRSGVLPQSPQLDLEHHIRD
jgi:hypothetical protein